MPDLPRALVAQPNRQPTQIMSVETIGDLAREASIDQLVTGLATFGPAYTRWRTKEYKDQQRLHA